MTNSNNNSLRNRHDINMSMTTSTHQHRHYHLIIPHFLLFAGLFPLSYTMMLFNTYYKKNSKIDTVSVDILFQINSTQLNDIKFMWEEIGHVIRPAKRRCWCYSTKRRKTDGDDGTNESNRDTPTTQRIETQRLYMFRWASCHIQYTYNSSHKINLFIFSF